VARIADINCLLLPVIMVFSNDFGRYFYTLLLATGGTPSAWRWRNP